MGPPTGERGLVGWRACLRRWSWEGRGNEARGAHLGDFCFLPAAVVHSFRHGGGSIRFEPVAGAATNACRTQVCKSIASLFGEPGKFPLDDFGRQYGREFYHSRLDRGGVARLAAATANMV